MTKDIRITEKKVDDGWKEQAWKEKERVAQSRPSPQPAEPSQTAAASSGPERQTSQIFLQFLSSLGIQAMMHMGQMPGGETSPAEVNLEAAKEIIELLIEIKSKTQGNLSREETRFFEAFLPELQLKYASLV